MLARLGNRSSRRALARASQFSVRTFTTAAPFFDAQPRPYTGLAELTSGSKSLRELVGVTSSDASSEPAAVVSEAELARVASLSYLTPPQTPEEVVAAQKSLSGVISWLSKLSQFPLSSETSTPSAANAPVPASVPVRMHPASPLELLVSSLGGAGVVLDAAAPPLPGTTLSPVEPASSSCSAAAAAASSEGGVPLCTPASLLRLRPDAVSEGDPANGTGQDRLVMQPAAHTDRCYYTVPAAADDADAE